MYTVYTCPLYISTLPQVLNANDFSSNALSFGIARYDR